MGLPDVESIPDTGAVFTIGRSRFADNFASHFFIRQDPVVTIVCGDEHSAVVCQSGRLFVFGSNDWGQLGLGHKNHVSKPSCVKILKPEKVTNVACGRAHTLICTGGEKIFACGSDQEGQLGRGGLAVGESSSTPVLIHDCSETEGSRILQVAAGSHHSMALLNDGGVIAWGSNLEGQLGLPGTSGLVNKPTKVPIPEPVREISAGYYHTAFLTESGLIYVCGEAESGKLGIVVNFSTQAAPRQLQLPDPAAKIACGGHHSLVLTDQGALYCFGSNVSGQLGMGVNVTEVQTPKLLPRGETEGEVIAKISAGESHTAVVTESGKLFMCGDGRHGKLGLEENENNVHELTYAAKYEELVVTDVSCGGCHTILIGKRREQDVNGESGSINSEIGTKKSSLPPLKMPASLGRISGGGDILGGDKNIIDSAIKSVETGVTEARDNVRDTLNEAKEKLESGVGGVVKNVGEKIEEVKKNAEDNIESLKKGGEESFEAVKKSAEDNIESVKKDAEENIDAVKKGAEEKIDAMKKGAEEKIDAVKKGAEESVEAVKKSAAGFMGGVKDAISGIKKPEFPKKVADYVEEGNKTEELLNDLANETEEDSGSKKNEEEGYDLEKKRNLMEINEPDSDLQIPPPKPPRQKSGHEINSKGEKTASSSAKSSTSNCGNRVNKGESATTGGEDEGKKIEGVGDAKGDAKKTEEGQETETAQDDADVVQSPPPKTAGKMSKLFKGKKPQDEQNGVNGGGSATKSRVKSRTCALL